MDEIKIAEQAAKNWEWMKNQVDYSVLSEKELKLAEATFTVGFKAGFIFMKEGITLQQACALYDLIHGQDKEIKKDREESGDYTRDPSEEESAEIKQKADDEEAEKHDDSLH